MRAQTTTGMGMADASTLKKGFTFTLDKKCVQTATLTLTVLTGAKILAEREIPVLQRAAAGI